MATRTPKPPVTTTRTLIRTTTVPKPITTTPKPTLPPTIVPPITTTFSTIPTTSTTTSTTTTIPPSRVITFTSNSSVSRPPKTTTTTSLNAVASDSGGMSPGAVAGMVAGALAVLIGSVVGAFLLLKQRKKRMLFKGSSRDYKGYPGPDLSRLPVQRYKPDSGDEATAPGDDGDVLYRTSTLGPKGKRRIDVTSSYYDDEFNKASQSGYSESWTGFVANGQRQGNESGQRTPNSTGPLVTSATSLPLGSMSSQEELHEKGTHEFGYSSDDHFESQNLAHVMPMSHMPRVPSMRGSGYGYDHVPPMGPMGNLQHRGSGYYPSSQLRPHLGGPHPGPHPHHDFQGFQRPVSAYVPGSGSAEPYMRSPPFNHPYQYPRPPYGLSPPGAPRPYSAFSTSGNLQMPIPHTHSSATDLNTPISPVSPVSPSSTLVSPVSPTSTLLSSPQLYASDNPSAVVPVVTDGGDPSRTSGSNSTTSDSQTCVASPVFLPGDSSCLNVVPSNMAEGKSVRETATVLQIEADEYLDDGKEEVLLEPVSDADNEASPTTPPLIVHATKPTSINA